MMVFHQDNTEIIHRSVTGDGGYIEMLRFFIHYVIPDIARCPQVTGRLENICCLNFFTFTQCWIFKHPLMHSLRMVAVTALRFSGVDSLQNILSTVAF